MDKKGLQSRINKAASFASINYDLKPRGLIGIVVAGVQALANAFERFGSTDVANRIENWLEIQVDNRQRNDLINLTRTNIAQSMTNLATSSQTAEEMQPIDADLLYNHLKQVIQQELIEPLGNVETYGNVAQSGSLLMMSQEQRQSLTVPAAYAKLFQPIVDNFYREASSFLDSNPFNRSIALQKKYPED